MTRARGMTAAARSVTCLLIAVMALAAGATASGQSLWLEAGLAYDEDESTPGEYGSSLELGLRGTYPLGEVAGLYGAVSLQHAYTVAFDAGAWFSFRPGLEDPFGLQSHLGAGLSYAGGEFGLALTGALTYEVARGLALSIAYTHRPILLPRLSQRFDISAGIKIDLD